MPYPALIYRADNAPPPKPRKRYVTPRGTRILDRIEMLDVTMESVARRSGARRRRAPTRSATDKHLRLTNLWEN